MRKIVNSTILPIISYSQNREDIILASLFKDIENGFYVDIGAAHPDHLSVTKYFYLKGWGGINVEPSKRLYELLLHNRPRDTTYRVAVSNSSAKTAEFREYLGDGLSTLSDEMKNSYNDQNSISINYYVDYNVPVMSLSDILNKSLSKIIHFMKVDVEGFEFEVLESNDWESFRPRVICIESNHKELSKNWPKLLIDNDYILFYHDGLNDYYADTRFYKQTPTVDYNYIFNPRITSYLWAESIENQNRVVEELQTKNDFLVSELSKRPGLDGEGLRFRVLAKILLKKIDAVIVGKLAPAPPNMTPAAIGQIDFQDVKTYDKKVWDVSTKYAYPKKHNIMRRLLHKIYRKAKKLTKSVVTKARK